MENPIRKSQNISKTVINRKIASLIKIEKVTTNVKIKNVRE